MMHFLSKFFLQALIFLSVISFAACTSSLEDFQEEGEEVIRQLIQELQCIHTREELLLAAPQLKKLFNCLVDLMIAARELHEKYPYLHEGVPNYELNELLRTELNRIYRLEGGRKIIEMAQEQALHRLDAFEKRLMKRKANI